MTKNIMKYSKILKFYMLNPNYKVKSSNWQSFKTKGSSSSPQNRDECFYTNWEGPKLLKSQITPKFWLKLFQNE